MGGPGRSITNIDDKDDEIDTGGSSWAIINKNNNNNMSGLGGADKVYYFS